MNNISHQLGKILLPLIILGSISAQGQTLDSSMQKQWEYWFQKSNSLYYKNTDSAYAYSQKALSLAVKIGTPQLKGRSNTQIGLIHFLLQNFDSANYHYNKAINNFEQIKDTNNIIKVMANKGNVFLYSKHQDSATIIFLDVLKHYDRKEDTLNQANINGTLGNLFMEKENLDEARYHYYKSKHYFKLVNIKQGIAICNQNIGIIFKRKHQNDSAIYYFEQALKFFKENNYHIPQAQCLANMGEVFRIEKKTDKAERAFNEAIKIFTEEKAKRDLYLAILQKTELLYNMNRTSEGIKLIQSLHTNYIDLSKHNLHSTYDSLRYIGSKRINNYKESLQFLEKFASYNDSISKADLKASENELLAAFNVEKREQQIKLLQIQDSLHTERIRKQNLLLEFTLVSLILAIAIGFIIFSKYRLKHRLNQILTEKNEEIQSQSEEIQTQNEVLRQQKEDITASISYANLIQKAILEPEKTNELEIFSVNKPKDIVSGDFFWQQYTDKHQYVAVADCTGHGVPGAFMSILGNSSLNSIIDKSPDIEPASLLEILREKIKETLHQHHKGDSQNDGMDIALCKINLETQSLLYAGAYRPCWIARQGEIIELKADRQPIGIYPRETPFNQQVFTLKPEDTIYLFSDGLSDQQGGNNDKKLKISGLKEYLSELSKMPFEEQKHDLQQFITQFIGYNEQLDDILIAGIRIKHNK